MSTLPDDSLCDEFLSQSKIITCWLDIEIMSSLPDELWSRILEMGVVSSCCLTYKDLCYISMSSHRLHRLSSENYLWNHLISSDFYRHFPPSSLPPSFSSHSSKSLYKSRYDAIIYEQRRTAAFHARRRQLDQAFHVKQAAFLKRQEQLHQAVQVLHAAFRERLEQHHQAYLAQKAAYISRQQQLNQALKTRQQRQAAVPLPPPLHQEQQQMIKEIQ